MANSIKLNEMKKYHFIYKTTNLLNGKYYIGMHSTNNLKDGYLGSGTRLRRSIRKYGKENFQCEILEYCSDFDSLKRREKELVTEESIKDTLCMNLKPGGLGGFTNESHKLKCIKAGSLAGNARLNYLRKNDKQWSDNYYQKVSNTLKEIGHRPPNWTGKSHSSESKKKIGLANSVKQMGKFNSQYGKSRSQETKEKIRISLLGRKLSEETKKKISLSMKRKS